MRYVDVFNGDADGMCALHQLRLAEPVPPAASHVLVTGLKHEIELLARVDTEAVRADATHVTVLDLSLDRNRAALRAVLDAGATVLYFDHHFAGAVPVHPRLRAVLDPAPDTCTGALVDGWLGGRHRPWAIVAAFGDNQHALAHSLADAIGLDAAAVDRLRELGEALNYNAYGDSESDVLIHPRELYLALQAFADPLQFVRTATVGALCARRRADLAAAAHLAPAWADARSTVYRLPAIDWARRVSGTFANLLARSDPARAHAVLRGNADGTLNVSVRAPLQPARAGFARGADWLCRQFPTGGGRAAAAGIERLPESELERFTAILRAMRWE